MAAEIAVDNDYYTLEKTVAADDDWKSDTTSLASEVARGRLENGRRYQSLKSEEYWSPSDDQQFEAYETGHLVAILLDYHQRNMLHRAPLKDPKNILDVGTGKGSWAIDMADTYPSATVRGVDLSPPPVTWMPPNCVFELDDLLQEWTWSEPFDFIYLRHMLGSFDEEGWNTLYKRCYDNLAPGGWIEEFELDISVKTDDNSLAEDSELAKWGENFKGCSERAGRSLTVQETMRSKIEKAGFIDVHEQVYKVPIGPWAKDKVYKEVGQLNYHHWVTGMEGYAMWLLTKFGAPSPWTPDEVQVYLAKVRAEMKNPHIHGWHYGRKVWARKPRADELGTRPKEEPEETVIKPEPSP
ncbi:uncharacterized protein N7458_010016 [Penicillium daleae]|uniref:S-adenosyl-L-methionine-dependent methyltransferase n=1 Tax=Penicillium daleae TaxID=63821 RepID=A0AAD6FYL8_9EURO|nr:uncharacterized protein N7458_010016 [Penicillium daleae]KAJ5439018.1 hypothetical protein N7458_010016 [Penicillium daleae]